MMMVVIWMLAVVLTPCVQREVQHLTQDDPKCSHEGVYTIRAKCIDPPLAPKIAPS